MPHTRMECTRHERRVVHTCGGAGHKSTMVLKKTKSSEQTSTWNKTEIAIAHRRYAVEYEAENDTHF